MSPFFYIIVALIFANITLAIIFFTAYFTMGKERHTLIWAFTFIIGSFQWLVNIFKPEDPTTYWMLACSLSVGTILFGTWGHFVRTSSDFSRSLLFLSGVFVIAITYYFTAIDHHRGLRQSIYIYHTVFYLCVCGFVLLKNNQRHTPRPAEIGAAIVYFLFALAQGAAATAALMQGAENNPQYFEIYRTINFISLPTGYIGMSLFIVFILASDMSEKAKKANQEKSRFMAAASHDLRQPLNSMGLFIYALKQKLSESDEKTLPIVGRVENAHKELGGLFEGILELSRLDSGEIVVKREPVSLNGVLQPIVHELSQQAKVKGLILSYSPYDAVIITDPILLSRVFRNLVGNAIKYTEHGEIKVDITHQKGTIKIDVTDTGIGIPKSEFELIFSEYHQIANKRRDRKEGVGLGLSIVKKMCDLLGFKIAVRSELNHGSTFTLTIREQALTDNIFETESEADVENPVFTGLNVLVIDDESEILAAMDMILSSWGCEVDCASDYIQAIQKVKQMVPDVILSDYRLQDDMNGVEVLEAIQDKLASDVPAALITAEIDPNLFAEAQEKGYTVINKPIDPLKLRTYLEQI